MFDTTNKQFDTAEAASPLTIQQQMKQSGGRFAAGAEGYTADKVLASLEQGRRSTINDLNVKEVNQGLAQQQFDLQNIFQLVSGANNQSNAFAANAMNAAGFNTAGNPWGSALNGAASGASMGAAAGGWGALAGGIIGGAAGYFGGG